MSFLAAYIYDRIMADTEAACLRPWRQELLSTVTGNVLEIGAGTGANISFYNIETVNLTLCEPDPIMRKQLKQKIVDAHLLNVIVSNDCAEEINVSDHSMDCVVSTLVCCSVKDLSASLQEIKRVLKPGGRFIFLEHVAAEAGTDRSRWQNILNPVWKKIAGNCHLNRHTQQAIITAGFELELIKNESMRKAIPVIRPTIRGVAISPS
jgi:ubiquinone/menaquinone biosynthesis C-methylase UbiE